MMIRTALVHVWLLVALGVVSVPRPLGGVAAQAVTPPLWRLTFRGEFRGVAADGRSDVWEGTVNGAARGRVTVELRQVEGPLAAASPVWHVVTHWSVDDPAGARSFHAELEGMVDWRTGVTQLGGMITDGWMRGAWAEVEGRFVRGDPAGSVTISPNLAGR